MRDELSSCIVAVAQLLISITSPIIALKGRDRISPLPYILYMYKG